MSRIVSKERTARRNGGTVKCPPGGLVLIGRIAYVDKLLFLAKNLLNFRLIEDRHPHFNVAGLQDVRLISTHVKILT